MHKCSYFSDSSIHNALISQTSGYIMLLFSSLANTHCSVLFSDISDCSKTVRRLNSVQSPFEIDFSFRNPFEIGFDTEFHEMSHNVTLCRTYSHNCINITRQRTEGWLKCFKKWEAVKFRSKLIFPLEIRSQFGFNLWNIIHDRFRSYFFFRKKDSETCCAQVPRG